MKIYISYHLKKNFGSKELLGQFSLWTSLITSFALAFPFLKGSFRRNQRGSQPKRDCSNRERRTLIVQRKRRILQTVGNPSWKELSGRMNHLKWTQSWIKK